MVLRTAVPHRDLILTALQARAIRRAGAFEACDFFGFVLNSAYRQLILRVLAHQRKTGAGNPVVVQRDAGDHAYPIVVASFIAAHEVAVAEAIVDGLALVDFDWEREMRAMAH